MFVLPVIAHLIYAVIVIFIIAGLVERLGFCWLWWSGRVHLRAERKAPCAFEAPSVCVQLPMYNEWAVGPRVIAAAANLRWPRDRLEVQVLDDSSEPAIRAAVDAAAAEARRRGVNCRVLRRTERTGYKAGALEHGRKQTDAEFLALFDADFVPAADFLEQVAPRFFSPAGEPLRELALVQAQWAHLNPADSPLTLAQSLWLDDHHSAQMLWRSTSWRFVNFTGTAGLWRAAAIEAAGGWRAASLVEDCELSFRVLFAGYRTTFAPVAVPAELPGSVRAFKAQQKRWTLGWAQLIRLHARTLLLRHRCAPLERLHLSYFLLLSLQWPLWAAWQLCVPLLEWRGALVARPAAAALVYLAPVATHAAVASLVAAAALGERYMHAAPLGSRALLAGALLLRALPCALVAAAMLPHQACAWLEGIAADAAVFETTPKSGAGGAGGAGGADGAGGAPPVAAAAPRAAAWYALAEAGFVAYHAAWAVAFGLAGMRASCWRAAYPAVAVAGLGACERWPPRWAAARLPGGAARRRVAAALASRGARLRAALRCGPRAPAAVVLPGTPLAKYRQPLLSADAAWDAVAVPVDDDKENVRASASTDKGPGAFIGAAARP